MFPLTTMLAVSVILSLIFWLMRRGLAAASKCCPSIREAAFASLKARLRPVPAPVGPTDASEEREGSDR
jgi:hypothetical protein